MALDQALLELSETYGPNLESWRWGDAHQATHDHPVLGDVPVLRYFVNIRQSTSGGDTTLPVSSTHLAQIVVIANAGQHEIRARSRKRRGCGHRTAELGNPSLRLGG